MVVYHEEMQEEVDNESAVAEILEAFFTDETPTAKVEQAVVHIPMVWFPQDFHFQHFDSSMGTEDEVVQEIESADAQIVEDNLEECADVEPLQSQQEGDDAISLDEDDDNVVYITDSASEDSECEIILECKYSEPRMQDRNVLRSTCSSHRDEK